MSGALVDRELLGRAVQLLSGYANSGVSDAVSLECAQVCGVLRAALALPAQAAADAAEQEGIMAGLNGCVGTHNPYLFGDADLRDAWKRGNARVQAVRDDGYQQGKRAAALFAADAAGVLRQVALMAEAIQTADRLPEGSEDRRWAFTDYVNVESRLRREDPARLRALADALEVQG